MFAETIELNYSQARRRNSKQGLVAIVCEKALNGDELNNSEHQNKNEKEMDENNTTRSFELGHGDHKDYRQIGNLCRIAWKSFLYRCIRPKPPGYSCPPQGHLRRPSASMMSCTRSLARRCGIEVQFKGRVQKSLILALACASLYVSTTANARSVYFSVPSKPR